VAQTRVTRKLTAIVATDMVGYSRLMEKDEEGTIARQKAHRAELIDPKFAEHGGRIVKSTGDGLLVEFASAVDAVRCAAEIQHAMADREADVPADLRIAYRVGINIGDIVIDGDDILGEGVNIAARLEATATPGGVCVSGTVHEHIAGKLDLAFDDMGEQKVKNIERRVRVWSWAAGHDDGGPTQSELAPSSGQTRYQPKLAVLPFENQSNDRSQDYLASGISEDLLTTLSRSRLFRVVASGSTHSDNFTEFPPGARDRLNADYIVRGSVRRSGDRLRVTVQLIDDIENVQIWADRYDRDLRDVFDLQDEITAKVSAAIRPELTRAEIERTKRSGTESLGAWDHFVRAQALMHGMTRASFASAIGELVAAIRMDPEFSSAYAMIARCHIGAAYNRWGEGRTAELAKANTAVEQALQHDVSDPLGFDAKASLHLISEEYDEAVQSARRALELDPSLATSDGTLANALAFLGRSSEALEVSRSADHISPRDPDRFQRLMATINAHFAAADYSAAIEAAQMYLSARPNWYGAYAVLVASLALAGDSEGAAAAKRKLLELMPRFSAADVRRNPMFKQKQVVDRFVDGLIAAGVPKA
jgi:class 3 adenylate cyclase/TolB-like protein/Flp pilus assembly protein TadD